MSESGLARGGACDAVSGRSWLGFARDWLFCLSMPVLWQLNAQNVDIRVLQYCGRDDGGSLLITMLGVESFVLFFSWIDNR